MIPKIIHYCWFGNKELPDDAVRCINSWKRVLFDYEFKLWNQDNFDLNLYPYTREAYDNKKYAFVTDVVRLYALYHEGGIYMDTDVEVLKSYDPFLHHVAFSGFETNKTFPTGTMAAEKGSVWAKELLDQYEGRHFLLSDGSFDYTTNTIVITKFMLSKGMIANNKLQDFPGLITAYPSDYFCPKDHTTGLIHITENTICIHHFAGSWLPSTPFSRIRHKLKLFVTRILGEELSIMISDIVTFRIFR